VIRKITVQDQPRQIVCKILPPKIPSQKNKVGVVAQNVGPEFKLQYYKKKKEIQYLLLFVLSVK
jgi:hypothetical protein